MTLLEVLTALAIFLLAMVVFGGIIVKNGQISLDLQRQNLATRLCQSKMAEVAAGVVPLSSQGDTPFDEQPDYSWSVEADNGAVEGLWNVTVTVKGPPSDTGAPVQVVLAEMVVDPSIVGSTQDVTPPVSSATSASNTGSSSSPSSPTSTSPSSSPMSSTGSGR